MINIVTILAVFSWLTADVTIEVVMNQVADGLCCSDKDAVLVTEKEGVSAVLIASAPHKSFTILNASFGVMKYFLGSRRNHVCTIKGRKADRIGHILRRNCLLKQVTEGKI